MLLLPYIHIFHHTNGKYFLFPYIFLTKLVVKCGQSNFQSFHIYYRVIRYPWTFPCSHGNTFNYIYQWAHLLQGFLSLSIEQNIPTPWEFPGKYVCFCRKLCASITVAEWSIHTSVNFDSIGSDIAWSLIRHQEIIWADAGNTSIEPLGKTTVKCDGEYNYSH